MLTQLRPSADRIAKTLCLHAKRRASLGEALEGRMLEIGAGLAALSLGLAKQFPTARFTAIDNDSGAAAVARLHVAASGFTSRFSVRLRDVIHVDEQAVYTAAWLPAPFLSRQGAKTALDRLTLAIAPRGFLIIGNVLPLGDDAATAATGARLLRSAGHVWRSEELADILIPRGYREIERVPCADDLELSIARRS